MNYFLNNLSIGNISAVLVSLGVVMATDAVNAATLTEVDATNLNGTSQIFKVESRAGRPGDTSVALSNQGTQGNSPAVWRTDWLNGQAYNFQLLYDSVTGTTTMTFDGITKSYNYYLDSPFSFDYLKVFAESKTDRVAEDTYIQLDIQSVNGMDSDIVVTATQPTVGDLTFLASDESITELIGSITLGWLGEENNPRANRVGSRVQLHLSGYGQEIIIPPPPIESVPESSSLLGLLIIGSLSTFSTLKGRKNV